MNTDRADNKMPSSLHHECIAAMRVAPIATPLSFIGLVFCSLYMTLMRDPWILFHSGLAFKTAFVITVCSCMTLTVFGGHIELETQKIARDEVIKKYGAAH